MYSCNKTLFSGLKSYHKPHLYQDLNPTKMQHNRWNKPRKKFIIINKSCNG